MYVNNCLKKKKITSPRLLSLSDVVLKDLMYFSRFNERAGLQEDSKQSVLKPTPLKRSRVQRPKPNLRRTVARQKDLTDEKDPEEEKTECGEVEKDVIHHRDENNDPCLKNVSFSSSCLGTLFFWVPSRSL